MDARQFGAVYSHRRTELRLRGKTPKRAVAWIHQSNKKLPPISLLVKSPHSWALSPYRKRQRVICSCRLTRPLSTRAVWVRVLACSFIIQLRCCLYRFDTNSPHRTPLGPTSYQTISKNFGNSKGLTVPPLST